MECPRKRRPRCAFSKSTYFRVEMNATPSVMVGVLLEGAGRGRRVPVRDFCPKQLARGSGVLGPVATARLTERRSKPHLTDSQPGQALNVASSALILAERGGPEEKRHFPTSSGHRFRSSSSKDQRKALGCLRLRAKPTSSLFAQWEIQEQPPHRVFAHSPA